MGSPSIAFQLAVAYFSPQPIPSHLPGLTQYAVQICSTGQQVVTPGGLIYAAAQSKISPVTRSAVTAAYLQQAGRSPWRITALVLEGSAWVATALLEGGVVKVKEKYRAALPVFAGGIRTVTTLVKAEVPPGTIPDNLIPPLVQIPAGGCVELVMFAKELAVEVPFTVQVQ